MLTDYVNMEQMKDANVGKHSAKLHQAFPLTCGRPITQD